MPSTVTTPPRRKTDEVFGIIDRQPACFHQLPQQCRRLGCTLDVRFVTTPCAIRHGVQPFFSVASNRAPAATSSRTAPFDPRSAAPCNAVSPLMSTVVGSPPSTRHSFTASAASSAVPGFSPGAQMAHAGRGHERRGVVGVGSQRIGAVCLQQPHQGKIGVSRCQEERGRTHEVRPASSAHVSPDVEHCRWSLQRRVQVRTMRQQSLDERQTVHLSGWHRERVVCPLVRSPAQVTRCKAVHPDLAPFGSAPRSNRNAPSS